ncbi:MAG: transglutaminase domain-containing protein [Phycisphaerae bacterium]|nr:transglutaminase domain-containing protein [Phycisphaerae bacterium]
MNCRMCRLVILAAVGIALVWTSRVAAAEAVPANAGFEQGQPGQAPAQWLVPKIPGFRVFVCDEDPKSGTQCLTIKPSAEGSGPFGNVMQRIDAAPFRGTRVRYRAAVRTAIDGQEGRAQLWLRVDRVREKGQRRMGFFDNMSDRPIRKKDWDYYEIVGDIAEDAEAICLGMFLAGSGQAWMDDVSLEIVDQDAEVTGRGLRGVSFDDIGPGLLEITGAMELKCGPSLVSRLTRTLGLAAKKADDKQEQDANVLIPVPLAYRQQVPVTYELTVDPPEVATSVAIYQDTPENHVAKVSVALSPKHDKVGIRFRSLVLVGPSSFSDVPDRVDIPDRWPEECQPWLGSTWCVDSQHERIQALSREIRENADDVMTLIAAVQERASVIFSNAQGQARDLTAVEALTGRGSCTSSANVVAALLRASHIPARVVAGYPSWSGPLQTHYIVEAYVPQFGWYPIESSMCKSPWPNEYQVNVAIVPPKYESRELADARPMAAGGVPYLSLTEMPGAPSTISAKGTIDPAANCDHQCKMIRKFPTDDGQWDSVLNAANSRWRKWLASEPRSNEKGQLVLGPKPETIDATSPSELMEELTR